jgi:nucleotide-binding universal stress UspA family protein
MSIVVCTPGGAAGKALVEAGVEQARYAELPLLLLQHVKMHDIDHAREIDREITSLEQARESLAALATTIAQEHGVACRSKVLASGTDNPSSELLDAAREEDVTMLVIGVRSRSRVGKFLMGSTTQDLLLSSGQRVLCVPVVRA